MKIGIMGAMREEVDVITGQMVDIQKNICGNRTYYEGKINNIDVVLVFSRWGKVAASSTVTTLITKFKINKLIFTGVAGAVSPVLEIGDVVISSKTYHHDMDASPIFPKYEVPLTGVTFFKADVKLVQSAQSAVKKLIKQREECIPNHSLKKFNIKKPQCYLGVIASGDQFISDPEKTSEILRNQPQALAVEMEGASVAQVCKDFDIPFVIIRTISDQSDHNAGIDFPSFISKIACHYSRSIIAEMFSDNTLPII